MSRGEDPSAERLSMPEEMPHDVQRDMDAIRHVIEHSRPHLVHAEDRSRILALLDSMLTILGEPAGGAPQCVMACRLIELADTSLHVLANWRRRFPEDLSIHAFGLMERHLRDLQRYFQTKLREMSERAASNEASAVDRRG